MTVISNIRRQKTILNITNILPWRLRPRFEQIQLGLLRFCAGLSELSVREGDSAGSLIAVGDIALHGSVATGVDGSVPNGFSDEMQNLLKNSDLRIGNLETIPTDVAKKTGSIGGFLTAPIKAASVLTTANFNILSLANNHARDSHLTGLLQCCQLLDEKGIQYCGAGPSLEKSRSPAIVTVAGVKIGMLGYCDNFRIDEMDFQNVAPAPAIDELIENDICALRQQVDLVIVQLHWGWEFSFYPHLSYRNRARRFAEIGADLVLCHHAHIPMGVEVWKHSLIAHGLGNFVFERDKYLISGHPWSYRTIALKVFFNKSGVLNAEIIPCMIDEKGFPNIATGRDAAEILGGLGRISSRICDEELLAWVEHDRTVRVTVSFLRAFQKCDPSIAHEWALQLHSILYQNIMCNLENGYGAEGKQLAAFLQLIKTSYSDPILASCLVKRSNENEIDLTLTRFCSANPYCKDLPAGRVP